MEIAIWQTCPPDSLPASFNILFFFNYIMRNSSKNSRRLVRHRGSRKLRVEALETRRLLAAELLQLTIENLSVDDGLAQTPFWVALHDGGFDLGNPGESTLGPSGLELIAEDGDPADLVTRFSNEGNGNDQVIASPAGLAPVFEPGETVTDTLMVDDTQIARYFSFASMVIPSNDAFIANLNPTAFEIFDASGTFLGDRSIIVYGEDIYDAGTEVNDPNGGAAFSAAGGTSADENGVIETHPGLDDFVGTQVATGGTLSAAFADQTPIARITISLASNPSGPIDSQAPRVTFDTPDLNQRADFHEVSVVYSDPSGIDVTSIDTADIRVTSPFLTQLNVLSVSTDAAAGTTPTTVRATYRVAPDTGAFAAMDNGTYSVVLNENQVGDTLAHTADAQLLGTFDVNAPERLQVTFENLAPLGGLSQTPVWVGVHNGGFRIAQAGVSASGFGGLEELAEDGILDGLVARFAAESSGDDAVLTAPGGFGPAPIFEPGETEMQFVDVHDPFINRFFSFASMVIPSNDAFIANLDPRAYELFDSSGNFTGARSITIYGQDVWDAGTEVNDPAAGPAFSTAGGVGVDENGVVRRHSGLDDFIGTGLPTGDTLQSAFESMTPLARLTISLADNPSSPIDLGAPQATLDAADVVESGGATHEIRVTYSDPSGIDLASIDVNDLEIVSGFSRPLDVVGVTIDPTPSSDARSVTAVYEVASQDGTFSTLDNGVYHVNLLEGQVSDTLANSVGSENLGSFDVLVPVRLQITIDNLAPDGGLAGTPFWVAAHNGNFEVARSGLSAADFGGLELLAEEGDVSELVARFASESSGVDAVVTAPGGFAGAPVFEPGESSTLFLDVNRTDIHRYFSFANMVIPSNDAFLANLNSRAYELFDVNGVFLGNRTIDLFGSDVLDAGTEVNDPAGGAAFSTEGGTSVDENGVIRRHDGLDDFIGTGLPTGEDLQSAFDPLTPLARITISLAGNSTSPIDASGPLAVADASDVTTVGAASHTVSVTFNDPAGIDLTSIGTDDISVTGPLGSQLRIVSATTDAPAGTTPRSATVQYVVATDDDQFTARNNGSYSISVGDGAVRDTLGHPTESTPIGEFRVDVGIRIQVEIESLTPAGGLAQTPFWVGFHNGDFEVARTGVSASQFPGLELLAEEGDVSGVVAQFAAASDGIDSIITAPDGFAGAPVLEPGEVTSQIIEITDTNLNRYFSFASMVIPSNDAFIANLDPRRYRLFDSHGNFEGAREITLSGSDVLDAGTEVNDPVGGAAFALAGGTPTDENGVITAHMGLNDFIGSATPIGDLQSAFDLDTPFVRITITMVDPPASACSGVIGACSVSSVPLQNQQIVFDVNNDGSVTALDALLVINYIQDFGVTSTIADEARALNLFLDVGGDDLITPFDSLLVINRLEQLANPVAESEQPPESQSAVSQSAAARAFSTDLALEQLLADSDDREEFFVETVKNLF